MSIDEFTAVVFYLRQSRRRNTLQALAYYRATGEHRAVHVLSIAAELMFGYNRYPIGMYLNILAQRVKK